MPFGWWWPVVGGALAGLLLRFVFQGDPDGPYAAMQGSFIVGSPILVAVVTVAIAEYRKRRSWSYYFVVPAAANALYVLGALLILIEGLICAVIIVPLFMLIGGAAGLIMGALCRLTGWPPRAALGCAAALPLVFGAFEHQLPLTPSFREQFRELHVAAPPEVVWRQLIDVRDIHPAELDDAWMYRIGVPLPSQGALETRDGERLRHVTMGKGIRFQQVATDWVEQRLVSWRYRFAADSFPPGALDDHVRIGGAYFDLGETTYSLAPEGTGTRLSVRMRYRVSTNFNWYAARVADLLVGDFAAHVLGFYARRAERASTQAPS
jgi:hypothetical protein